MLDFASTHKATIAQASIHSVLTYAGYRVSPIGVETRCPEIVYLNKPEYDALDIPDALRTTPDLAAYAPPVGPLHLVEIKYVSSWSTDSLRLMASKLERQRQYYRCVTVILRARSAATEAPGVDDLVRVLLPDQLVLLSTAQVLARLEPAPADAGVDSRLEPIWQSMEPLSTAFDRLAARSGWQDMLIRALPALASGPPSLT